MGMDIFLAHGQTYTPALVHTEPDGTRRHIVDVTDTATGAPACIVACTTRPGAATTATGYHNTAGG